MVLYGREFTIVAGASLLVLAAAILLLQPRSPVYRAFALLLLMRGLVQTLLGIDDTIHAPAYRTAMYAAIALPFAAINFAIVYAEPGGAAARRAARWLILAVALATAMAYMYEPSWFLGEGGLPGLGDVILKMHDAAHAGIALLFLTMIQHQQGKLRRGGLLLMSAGFALEPAFETTWQAVILSQGYPVDTILFLGFLVLLSTLAFLVSIVVRLAALAYRAPQTPLQQAARRYLWALWLPVLSGVAVVALWNLQPGEWGIQEPFFAGLNLKFTAGAIWKISLVAIAAFALARYQILGIERAAKVGLQTVAMVLLLVAAYMIVGRTLGGLASELELAPVAVAAAVVALAAWPALPASKTMANTLLPGVNRSPAYAEARRLEMFAHQAEELLADGLLMDEERAALEECRLRFGLDEEEAEGVVDRVIEQLPPLRTSYFAWLGERDGKAAG